MKEKSKETKELKLSTKILRTTFVVLAVVALCLLVYYVLVVTGVWEQVNTAEKLKNVILSWGIWGRLGFVIIQFLQVTFLPLPSTVTIIAGTLVYGPLEAALLSISGILVGSLFAFFLGRVFGKKIVAFMVGEKTCEKWTKFLTNAKYSFVVMMILPVFPDDVLCLVAGLTDMSWAFFTITNLIARPLGVFMVSYLGSGHLIPYYGWGLAVWAVIAVVVIAILILSYKYQKQIENFLLKIFSNKKVTVLDTSDKNEKIAKDDNEFVARKNERESKNIEKTQGK